MKARIAITALVALLIFCAGYAALFIAPDEATMHAIQRIFYFHVASWNAMFCAFFVAFYASVAYLVTGKRKWDALGVSAVEVGVMCCTIGLITGPLWARPVWGIWWTWDAKLTSTFILWLLFIAYLLLRGLVEDPEKKSIPFRCLRNFRVSRYPARLSGESFVAHPASTACDCRRTGFRPRSHDWKSIALLPHRRILRNDIGAARSLSAGTVAQ